MKVKPRWKRPSRRRKKRGNKKMIRKPKQNKLVKHKRKSGLHERKPWIWQRQNIYQVKEMWIIMWVIARLQIMCNETPKLPGCHCQNTLGLTKYDHVTTKPCSQNSTWLKTKTRKCWNKPIGTIILVFSKS